MNAAVRGNLETVDADAQRGPKVGQASSGARAKLAALRATLMFLYVYADVLSLYRPGVIDDIRDEMMGTLEVSQAALLAAASKALHHLPATLSGRAAPVRMQCSSAGHWRWFPAVPVPATRPP